MARLQLLNAGGERSVSSLLEDAVIFGKSSDVDLVLNGRGVSRRHGRFFRAGDGRWWIEDLGSRNGTHVNNRSIEKVPLTSGDTILVGELVLTFLDDTFQPRRTTTAPGVTISNVFPAANTMVERPADSIRAMDNRRLAALYEISKRLLDQQEMDQLVDVAAEALIGELQAQVAVLGLTRDPEGEPEKLLVRPQSMQHTGVTLSRSILYRTIEHRRAILVADTSIDLALAEAQSIVSGGIRSALCVPLLRGQAVSGFIYVDSRHGGRRYEEGDLEFASAVGAMVGTAIENARLRQAEMARQRMQAELDAARRVQRAILPSRWVKLEGWDIDGVHTTSREVGGDYYDAILTASGHLWLVIADVCGKGAPAALQASSVHAAVHALVEQSDRPSELLTRLNALLLKRQVDSSFVTCMIARIAPATGETLIASAGHPEPIYLSLTEPPRPVTLQGGLVLGALAGASYADTSWSLAQPDSMLLLYTDGLSETFAPDGTAFDEGRLRETLTEMPASSAKEVLARLQRAAADFRGCDEASDDLTLLACHRLPT